MVEIGRDPWRSSVPPVCSSRGSFLPKAITRLLYIFKEGDSTTSLGNLWQWSVTLAVKKWSLMFKKHHLFQFVPVALVLSPDTAEKNLSPHSLQILFRSFSESCFPAEWPLVCAGAWSFNSPAFCLFDSVTAHSCTCLKGWGSICSIAG